MGHIHIFVIIHRNEWRTCIKDYVPYKDNRMESCCTSTWRKASKHGFNLVNANTEIENNVPYNLYFSCCSARKTNPIWITSKIDAIAKLPMPQGTST